MNNEKRTLNITQNYRNVSLLNVALYFQCTWADLTLFQLLDFLDKLFKDYNERAAGYNEEFNVDDALKEKWMAKTMKILDEDLKEELSSEMREKILALYKVCTSL